MKSQTLRSRAYPAKPLERTPTKIAGAGQKPIAIHKILVPTDFSPASRNAVAYALRLARKLNCDITLLHVLEPSTPLTTVERLTAAAFSKKEMANAQGALSGLVHSAIAAGGTNTKSMLRTGIATHEIVEVAKQLDVDLIVIATHGLAGRKHLAIGSTAERVARAAPCPVLVVRENDTISFCVG